MSELNQMGWMAPAPGIAMCQSVVPIKDHEQKEPSAMNVTTIGLDLAKNVFQVHGIDEAGNVIARRSLRRRQMIPYFDKLERCRIGMEACGTSHYWARELAALGHDVNLMPPAGACPRA
jgi:transposase